MDKKEKKTGATILLLMVIAMAILAATEGWLQDSTLHEVMLQEESMQDGAPDADSLPVPVPESANEYPGIIRFHVIANSNSQKDQNIKYMVRNHVFCKLENQLTAAMLRQQMRRQAPQSKRRSQPPHQLPCRSALRKQPARQTAAQYAQRPAAPISKPTCLRSRRGRRTACAPPGVAIRRAHSMASAPYRQKAMTIFTSRRAITRR